MDSFLPRIQLEPVVPGLRGSGRAPERRRRGRDGDEEEHGEFPLEARPAPGEPGHHEHDEHAEPRSPDVEGLGGKLDLIA